MSPQTSLRPLHIINACTCVLVCMHVFTYTFFIYIYTCQIHYNLSPIYVYILEDIHKHILIVA